MQYFFVVLLLGIGYHTLLSAMEETAFVKSGQNVYRNSFRYPSSEKIKIDNRFWNTDLPKENRKKEVRKKKTSLRKYAAIRHKKPGESTVEIGYKQELGGDFELAIVYYLKSISNEDDARAFYLLGRLYARGRAPLEKDENCAIKYFKRAAKYGCPDAQYELSLNYESGSLGLAKNSLRALKWLRESAKNGHPEAWSSLRVKDFVAAEQYLLEAADNNCADAQYILSQYFEVGNEKYPLNEKLAREWLIRAVENGHIAALNKYFELCEAESANNPTIGEQLTKTILAVEQTTANADAQLFLAEHFYQGSKLIVRDTLQALRWYKKAAKNGNEDARRFLKNYYLRTKIVNRDGGDEAFFLARCYQFGTYGFDLDQTMAINFYINAAKNGHGEAVKIIEKYVEEENAKPDLLKKACKAIQKYYLTAAANGNVEAQHVLADCFATGNYGFECSEYRARYWDSEAKKNGWETEVIVDQKSRKSNEKFYRALEKIWKVKLENRIKSPPKRNLSALLP